MRGLRGCRGRPLVVLFGMFLLSRTEGRKLVCQPLPGAWGWSCVPSRTSRSWRPSQWRERGWSTSSSRLFSPSFWKGGAAWAGHCIPCWVSVFGGKAQLCSLRVGLRRAAQRSGWYSFPSPRSVSLFIVLVFLHMSNENSRQSESQLRLFSCLVVLSGIRVSKQLWSSSRLPHWQVSFLSAS